MPRRLAEHGVCLVCGSENPHGFGLTWYLDDEGRVLARFAFQQAQQGPPGHVHGGALAAVLDEAMGAAAWAAGYPVLAAEIRVRYIKPVPLYRPVTVEARILRVEARKVYTEGRILLEEGTEATTAQGLFIQAPHLFKNQPIKRWQPLDEDIPLPWNQTLPSKPASSQERT